MLNYFNYFTEIEERFQQRRGSLLMLSTLDWALIETWREGGIPLPAVLRGIDDAFDRREVKKAPRNGQKRKVNGLAWCSQAVIEAYESSLQAATGILTPDALQAAESGFELAPVALYLQENAAKLRQTILPPPAADTAGECARRLEEISAALSPAVSLEDLDRTLAVLEEKLFAAIHMAAPESQLVELREQATRELSPYRSRMPAMQIKQVQQQMLQKRLFEAYRLPRLSLFYMSHR